MQGRVDALEASERLSTAACANAKEKARADRDTLCKTLSRLKQDRCIFLRQIDALKEKLEQHDPKELKRSRREAKVLQGEVNELHIARLELATELGNLQRDYGEAETLIQTLRDDHEDRARSLKSAQARLHEAQEKLAQATGECRRLQTASALTAARASEIDELKCGLKEQQRSRLEEHAAFEEKLAHAHATATNSKQQLQDLGKSHASLCEELERTNRTCSELRETLEKASVLSKQEQTKNAAMSEQLNEMGRVLEKKCSAIESAHIELDCAKSDRDHLESRFVKLQAVVQRLRHEETRSANASRQLRDDLRRVKHEMKGAEAKLKHILAETAERDADGVRQRRKVVIDEKVVVEEPSVPPATQVDGARLATWTATLEQLDGYIQQPLPESSTSDSGDCQETTCALHLNPVGSGPVEFFGAALSRFATGFMFTADQWGSKITQLEECVRRYAIRDADLEIRIIALARELDEEKTRVSQANEEVKAREKTNRVACQAFEATLSKRALELTAERECCGTMRVNLAQVKDALESNEKAHIEQLRELDAKAAQLETRLSEIQTVEMHRSATNVSVETQVEPRTSSKEVQTAWWGPAEATMQQAPTRTAAESLLPCRGSAVTPSVLLSSERPKVTARRSVKSGVKSPDAIFSIRASTRDLLEWRAGVLSPLPLSEMTRQRALAVSSRKSGGRKRLQLQHT